MSLSSNHRREPRHGGVQPVDVLLFLVVALIFYLVATSDNWLAVLWR